MVPSITDAILLAFVLLRSAKRHRRLLLLLALLQHLQLERPSLMAPSQASSFRLFFLPLLLALVARRPYGALRSDASAPSSWYDLFYILIAKGN